MSKAKSIETLLASIHTGLYMHQQVPSTGMSTVPFITISRQAGARGMTLANVLQRQLSERDGSAHPWVVWDRELVERVALEQGIARELVERVDERATRIPWFQDLLDGLCQERTGPRWTDREIFQRTAITIRTLACLGRCIIVGRGGVYATADLPGGIHVRLVGAFPHRVRTFAEANRMSERDAAAEVRRIDQFRDDFHRQHWPERAMLPEIFTLTLNAERLDERTMGQCILPILDSISERGATAVSGASCAAVGE